MIMSILTYMLIRLQDARVGDVILDERPVLRRLPRTMRYICQRIDIVRMRVIEPACQSNRWRVMVEDDSGRRFCRDTQWVKVERDTR